MMTFERAGSAAPTRPAPAGRSGRAAGSSAGPRGGVATVAFALFLFLSGASCQSAPARQVGPPRDYHFSPGGDDASGDGSPDRPFRSVDRANRLKLNPGDRVLFEAGQNFNGNLHLDAEDAGTPELPVTVGSYSLPSNGTTGVTLPTHGRATIRAGVGTGLLIENAGGVRVADLVVLGDGPSANRGSGVEFRNTLDAARTLAFVRVDNVEARGFGREGIFVHGRPKDGSHSGYADVAITDCVARENKLGGVYVTGFWAGEVAQAPRALPHRDVRVRRCLAADNPGDPAGRDDNRSGSGIFLDGVAGGLIEHCEATNNGAANRAKDGGPVGIWCTISDRVAIQNCRSHRNRTGGKHDGGGFCLDGGVCNSVLRYNVSEENDGSGYGLYEYPWAPPANGNAIHDNVSRDDGRRNGYAGIHVWDDARTLRDVRIERNRVLMNAVSASTAVAAPTASSDASATAKPPRGLWIQSPIRDSRVADNVFEIGPGVRLMDIASGQWNVRFEGNAYQTGGDRVAVEWEGREFTSLRAWLAATGERAAAAAAQRN
jgi:hypothetical protein